MSSKPLVHRLPDEGLRLSPSVPAASVPGAFALLNPLPSSVVILGTFDGVHLGHQQLIARGFDRAQELGVPLVAYTFDPHPARLLAPHAAPPLLLPAALRVRLLADAGVDVVVVEPFTETFAQVSADEWVERFLVERLRPRHVIAGFNFSYGRDRGGSAEHLKAAGERLGFGVEIVEPVEIDDGVVSSTRIRKLVLEGRLDGARRLLGRPYALTAEVIEGDRRGRTIGFRTANLHIDGELVPAHGVYATRASLADGRCFASVTNIGRRPTFDTGHAIETHLLDFDEDLYHQRLALSLIAYLRPEKKFDDVDALVQQIHIDIAEARSILGGE